MKQLYCRSQSEFKVTSIFFEMYHNKMFNIRNMKLLYLHNEPIPIIAWSHFRIGWVEICNLIKLISSGYIRTHNTTI